MPDNIVNKAIVCSMCGELGKAEIYTSVNTTVNKALRSKVLDGELFSWQCPSCNYRARLNYPILYNDMKNRYEQTVLVMSTMKHFGHEDKTEMKLFHGTHCQYHNQENENGENLLGIAECEFMEKVIKNQ